MTENIGNLLIPLSESWLLNTRCLFEDHLNAILQSHPLERLLPLQVILLVNLVQVFDFLAPLILLFKVTEVLFDLFLSLLHASSDLLSLLSRLLLLHFFDLCKALLWRQFIWTTDVLLYLLFSFDALDLHFLDLVHVGVYSLIFGLLFLFFFPLGLFSSLFGPLDGSLLFHFQLLLLRPNLLLESLFSDDYSLHDLFLIFPFYHGSFIAFRSNKLPSLLVALEVLLEFPIILLFLIAFELLSKIVLLPRVLKDLCGRLSRLQSTLPLALSIIFLPLLDLLTKHRILSFTQLLNSFLFLIFRLEDILLLFLEQLSVLITVFSHSLL